MLPRLGVSEMIEAFGSTYRTIDLRCAAVKDGNIWKNIYTVIRFSYEEIEVAESRLRRLEKVHGAVRTESFRILLGGRPFSEWDQVRRDLETDRLRVEDLEAAFRQPIWVNLSRTLAFLNADYSAVRPFDSCQWPVAQYVVVLPSKTGHLI